MLRAVSIIGLVLMVVPIIFLFRMEALLCADPIGITVQILAVALMIWARVAFGRRSFHAAGDPTEGGLVTTGPYHFVRHPIYASVLYFVWAGVVTHGSLGGVALGILCVAGAAMRMAIEEKLVRERYPEYAEYAERVKRVIPFLV
jgi:protein-S-isoprenylcysteine O-methyltransferase Ste14